MSSPGRPKSEFRSEQHEGSPVSRNAEDGAEDGAPSRADQASDRAWGPLWVVLGAAITVGALRIDRLESQGVEWFAAPGLLPGVLGVIIMLNGLLIAVRARRTAASAADAQAGTTSDWRRIGLTLLLCLGFAVGLVGHGLHFGVAAGLYLFSHIALLQWNERKAAGQTVRGLLVAAAVAVSGGLIVPFIFESVFLVRLP